jgi:uncharacterized protein YcfJ
MKRIIAIATFAALSTPALAQQVNGVVEHHFKTQTISRPYTERVCSYEQVPVYGRTGGGQASVFDKLGGAIIGGAIGNQFGAGSGKDAMTVLGAIAGADVAGRQMDRGSNGVVGYRQQEVCNNVTRYDRRQETVYDYSTITFDGNTVRYIDRGMK